MDQLVNNITSFFKEALNCKVVMLRVQFNANQTPICSNTYFSPVTYVTSQKTIKLYVEIEDSRLDKNQRNFLTMFQDGALEPLLEDCGVLTSLSSSMSPNSSTFISKLEIMVHDMERLKKNSETAAWKTYSQEFDELLEKKLND